MRALLINGYLSDCRNPPSPATSTALPRNRAASFAVGKVLRCPASAAERTTGDWSVDVLNLMRAGHETPTFKVTHRALVAAVLSGEP